MDDLVHLGLNDDPARWLPLLRGPEACEILSVVGRFGIVVGGIADVSQAVRRASQIAFSFSRYPHQDREGRPTWGHVEDGLDAALVLHQHLLAYGIDVGCELPELPELPPLLGHHDELDQVWTNLVRNAVHAMSGRGRQSVRLAEDDEWLRVTIQDDGPGTPEAVLARVFEPLLTTKAAGEGTGLGLAVSREIVVGHGGTLEIDSKPGVGTTVRVTLPTRGLEPGLEEPGYEDSEGPEA